MESLRDSERRTIPSDPNFNFFSIGGEQREGSIALSDISFPSHVSELESFQSELDLSLCSRDSISTQGDLQLDPDRQSEIGVLEPASTTHNHGDCESTKSSMLPDLPEQTSENINMLLAALKAATVKENESDCSNGNKSKSSSGISNQDSSLRFISKESFPESVFSQRSSTESLSWGKDMTLNPEELVHQPSSTPFSGEKLPSSSVQPDSDSRMSEKFLAASKTPGPDPIDSSCPDSAASNPWSFSGTSMLLQTTVGNTFHQAENEPSCKANTTKTEKGKSLLTYAIQKKLWTDTPERSTTSDHILQRKDSTVVDFESPTTKEKVFNPFDDSIDVQTTFSNGLKDVEGCQDLFKDDEFSFGEEFQEDFSFQSAGDAASRLDKDEVMFMASHIFDKDVMLAGDNTIFGDGVLPDGRRKSERRSLPVIGISDPNDKGELRISFGDFFAAKTEELGRLGDGGEDGLRPQFSNTSLKVSPVAAIPRPLHRPSSPEGGEGSTLPRQSSNNLRSDQPKPQISDQNIDSLHHRNSSVKRSSPSGAEDRNEDKAKQGKNERRKVEKEKEREKEKNENEMTRRDSADPNTSAMAALKFCHSSQGSKILGMSAGELKSLSSTLAKVTQGDPREIYKVLVDFICEERRLSQTTSELNEDSHRLSDVFFSEKKKGKNDLTTVDRTSYEEQDEVTFYHSDTSCEVSPTGSKFERLATAIPSPPLDSSSPKSTASSIAVQTESHEDHVTRASTQVSTSIPYHTVTSIVRSGCSAGTLKATEQYPLLYPSVQMPEGLTSVAHQTSVPSTGVLPSALITAQDKYPTSTSSHIGVPIGHQNTVMTRNQAHLTANQVNVCSLGMATELVPLSEQMNLAAMASQTYDTSAASSGSSAGMVYPMSVSSAGFASQPVPHSVALTWQPVHKGRTISGGHAMFYDKRHVVGQSLQPRPRSAFDGHGFFTSPAPVKSRGNLGDSSGMYKEMAQLNTRTWDNGGGGGGTNVNPISHRQEGWNWRTERTSQIQMVIPPALDFPGVLCVGMSAEALLPLHNPTSRWIRCSSMIISCTANGVQVNHLCDCPFSIRETTLIGPKLTENVKVEFLCMVAGIYVAEMKVVSTPVGSIDCDSETSSALVNLQGFSEKPQLEIFADDGQTLDFGEIHHGCNSVRPLRIDNKGRTKIPLKMLICSSSSPGIFVFSKNNSPDAIENLQIQSSALKCLLPATNDLDLKPQPLTIWIEMVGKNHHCFEKSNQAEIFSAGINIQLDVGAVPKILGNVPLKGVIGFTKIQIPKAFQMAMCLSSSVGRKVSRQLPFSNAGNISANVELTIPKYSDVFVTAPNKFQVRPETAVTVEVSFSPRVKGSYESVIQVSELGDNKSYEVLLRGSSIEPQTTVEEEGPPILSNKSCLCWTGVDIGKAAHQRLFLLNDSSERSVHFQAVILGEHADFAIQRMRSDFSSGTNSSEPMSLRPKERIPIYVLFAPSSLGVFKSALVLKPDRGPRFQVPLYAYGGTSDVSICGQSKTTDGYVADLGQISLGHRNILKITLKNSGNRAAFVKVACYSDIQIRLLYPNTHLSIVPSEFILPERSSKELVIVFQPLQHDAKTCQTQVKRVATVVFYYGDEVLRQWYKRNLIKQHDYQGRKSNENSQLHDLRLDKVFEDENCVAEEFDYPAVENWSEVFNSHLTQVPLDLMGGPERLETTKSIADDGGSMLVMAAGQTPAQKERGTEKNKAKESGDNNKTAMWTIIPERLSLKVPVEGSTDTTKKVQLLNFSDRPLEFEFIWPGHCVAVTPHRGTIPPKNQTVVHVGVWASISSSGIELPWCGTAYVNCDGTKKELAIQIHRHLVSESSPAPSVINKPLTLFDPDQDRTLLLQTYTRPQKHTPPLTVTPKRIEFPETEVGSVTSSTVALSNVSTSSVRWKVSSVAPAYSKVSQTSTELFRATYAVFRFSSRGGLLRPGQTVKIDVEFQTRDPGEYCQIWDVQTNPESPLTSTKTQMELSGKTIAQKVTSGVLTETRGKLRVSDPVCEKEPVAASNVLTNHEMPSEQTTESTQSNLNIYFESDNIWFPNTEVGETSAVKIKICNRSSTSHKFRIVNPQPPFSVKCLNILTKPTHYLRIPVYFSPNEPSKHYEETVVFSNSKSGTLLSVKLQGTSLPAK